MLTCPPITSPFIKLAPYSTSPEDENDQREKNDYKQNSKLDVVGISGDFYSFLCLDCKNSFRYSWNVSRGLSCTV